MHRVHRLLSLASVADRNLCSEALQPPSGASPPQQRGVCQREFSDAPVAEEMWIDWVATRGAIAP